MCESYHDGCSCERLSWDIWFVGVTAVVAVANKACVEVDVEASSRLRLKTWIAVRELHSR